MVVLTVAALGLSAHSQLDRVPVFQVSVLVCCILAMAFPLSRLLLRPLSPTITEPRVSVPAHLRVLTRGLEGQSVDVRRVSEALCEESATRRNTETASAPFPARPVITMRPAGVASTCDPAAERLRQYGPLVVEACPSGMIMTDGVGRILLVNRETERLFGYRREELLGQTIELLAPERLRAAHILERRGFTARPAPRQMGANRDLFGRRKDGTEFPVEIALNPIQSREGMLALSVVVDISERKRLERLKDEFVATVSHELRTPLTPICASLALLTATAQDVHSESAHRLVQIAHSNSVRLVRLINDILDIEKIESGKIQLEIKTIALRPFVEQTIEASRPLAASHEVGLRLEDPGEFAVHADSDRLAQIITNLLSNAIKFSPPGAEVAVTLADSDEYVRISVRDHGSGIPQEFRSRVFEKFAQADSSNSRKKGGSGLGLSIVKQIVQRLGGEVGFADAPGGGTVFYVDLRRAESLADTSPEPLERLEA